MKKLIWLLPLALLIVACGSPTTELVPTETNANNEDTAVSNTDETTETTETAQNTGDSAEMAATNLSDFVPATDVDEAALLREQDWRHGATDPLVVIIEYGDFQ